MDKECEEIIVKNFFIKSIQDRVLYELNSSKKRKDAIGRLSHNYTNTLIEKYMIELKKPNSDYMEIYKLLKSYGAGDTCYVISFDPLIDGRHMPLKEALQEAICYGLPSIISCIPDKLLYFESEQVSGPPPRFILKKD